MIRRISAIGLGFLIFCGRLPATPSLGGVGLIYVHSAKVLPKGTLEFYAGTRYFGKIASFQAGHRAYTLWDVQGVMSLNYGISPHVQIGVSPVLYQDVNRNGGNFWKGQANLPDDVFLSLKVGSYSALESPFVFGGLMTWRLPTAKKHNIIYEPYSAGRFEVGLSGLISYYSKPSVPDLGWSAYLNLGYLNHNDVGKNLSGAPEDASPQSMTSELLFSDGFLYPMDSFSFSVEFNARYFITRPPGSAYSREYVSYMTTGIFYTPFRWLTVEMGVDFRLFSDKDQTSYAFIPPPPTLNFPNYPSWRGVLGLKWTILPRSLYQSDDGLLKQKAKDRKAILEKMMDQQTGDTGNAEQELSRIQTERKKIEDELERLRKLLEAEKQKDKKD
jgi:hypothetical protein